MHFLYFNFGQIFSPPNQLGIFIYAKNLFKGMQMNRKAQGAEPFWENTAGKKAQGAIEYLLIIGAAILVVAIVLIAVTGSLSASKNDLNSSNKDVNSAYDALRGSVNKGASFSCPLLGECNSHGKCTATNVCTCNSGWGRWDCAVDVSHLGDPTGGCYSGGDCSSGVCVTWELGPGTPESPNGFCASGAFGNSCGGNGDCNPNYRCSTAEGFYYHVCTNGAVLDFCANATECKSGYCNTFANKCTNGERGAGCGTNSDCAESGVTCVNTVCTLTN